MSDGTFGPAYDAALDGPRIRTQLQRIQHALEITTAWLTLREISKRTGDPEASVSAQLRHLRKERFGGYVIDKRRRGRLKSGLWEYSLTGKQDEEGQRLLF